MSFLLENSHHTPKKTFSFSSAGFFKPLLLLWGIVAMMALLIAGASGGGKSWSKQIIGSVWQGMKG